MEKGETRNRVTLAFNKQEFMRLIQAQLTHVGSGECAIEVAFRSELTQQHGLFHGGLLATLADNAGCFAAYSLMSEQEQPLSVEFKINFLKKALGDAVVARAKVIRNGRSLKTSLVDVFARGENGETHCAVAIVTVIATNVALT